VTLANLGAAHLESARAAGADGGRGTDGGGGVDAGGYGGGDREHLNAAMDLLNQALVIHREIGDERNEADTVRLLAVVNRELGDDARALELAGRALRKASVSGDLLHESSAHSTLATLLARGGDVQRALAEHERALQLAHTANAARETAEALIDLAETHMRFGQLDDAALAAADAQVVAARANSVVLARRARRVRSRVSDTVGRTRPISPVPAAPQL
jgi:tetratricopeptide (TPR) repeat protein